MRRQHQRIVMNQQVMNRNDRQVQLEWLPLAAIIERDVDAAFGAGKEQSFASWIFPDNTGEVVRRDAVDDLFPGCAVVRRFVEVGLLVTALVAGGGNVRFASLVRRSFDD